MVKRRSLDDALTPEEEIFLKKGKASELKIPKPKLKPKPRKEATPMNRPALKEEFADDTQPTASGTAQYSLAGTGSINARIDPHITTMLLRASVERRIQRKTPSTQRDIIAEALTDWFKKHGYLS